MGGLLDVLTLDARGYLKRVSAKYDASLSSQAAKSAEVSKKAAHVTNQAIKATEAKIEATLSKAELKAKQAAQNLMNKFTDAGVTGKADVVAEHKISQSIKATSKSAHQAKTASAYK